MHKFMLASLLCALSAGSAMAAESTGFYLRGMVGQADTDESGLDNDTAFAIGGGWRFLPYLSVEAGYNDFGNFEANRLNAELGADSWELGMAAKIPFADSGFFGQARVGIHRWDIDSRLGTTRVSVDGNDPYYGVGIGYDFNDQFGLTVSYDRYDVDDFDIDRIGLGGEVRF